MRRPVTTGSKENPKNLWIDAELTDTHRTATDRASTRGNSVDEHRLPCHRLSPAGRVAEPLKVSGGGGPSGVLWPEGALDVTRVVFLMGGPAGREVGGEGRGAGLSPHQRHTPLPCPSGSALPNLPRFMAFVGRDPEPLLARVYMDITHFSSCLITIVVN